MDNNGILSLLGLALRGGNLTVGEEPVEAAARGRDVRLLLLARDAAENTRRRTAHFAETGQCLWLPLPFTRAELGRAVGRTSAAIVAVTDIGLACAAARRLAELDPAQYAEASAKLEVKAKRAAERAVQRRTREKAGRNGTRRAKKGQLEIPKTAEKRAEGGQKTRTEPPPGAAKRAFSRPSKENRPKPRAKSNAYAHSRPVKKGKGSFRGKDS